MSRRLWSLIGVAAVAVAAVVLLVVVVRDGGPAVPPAPARVVAQNLQAQVTGPLRVVVGRPVEFVGYAVGSSAQPRETSFCFGDGSCVRPPRRACAAAQLPSPKAAALEVKRTHTFLRAGTYTVRFEVDSGCTGYSGDAAAVLTVTVVARL